MSGTGPGTLKCVISSRGLDRVRAALPERVSPDSIREIGVALIVHTDLEPAALRDWLSGVLAEGESLLVVEFEKWSGYGAGMDSAWLLARGH